VLNIVALALIQATPLPAGLLTVLVWCCFNIWVHFGIQKINLKNKWYLNFIKPNQHLTTVSDSIMIRVRKYTCKIQVPIWVDFIALQLLAKSSKK
jgi:hypothetical protein